MAQRTMKVSQVSGAPLEVAIGDDGPEGDTKFISGLQLRERIKHALDAQAALEIPIEMVVLLSGDNLVTDDEQIAVDSPASVQIVKKRFPVLDMEWMLFHTWENFLAGDEYACPTSCEDYVMFYREPSASIASGFTKKGEHLYAVTYDQKHMADHYWNKLQHVGKEVAGLENESDCLPPCRASVIPHLASLQERQHLAETEKLLTYTATEWRIAIYQEIEIKGRSPQEVFNRYPCEDIIGTFLSQMSWSKMQAGRPNLIQQPMAASDKCRVARILEQWLAAEPSPGNMGYDELHPTFQFKLEELIGIVDEAWTSILQSTKHTPFGTRFGEGS